MQHHTHTERMVVVLRIAPPHATVKQVEALLEDAKETLWILAGGLEAFCETSRERLHFVSVAAHEAAPEMITAVDESVHPLECAHGPVLVGEIELVVREQLVEVVVQCLDELIDQGDGLVVACTNVGAANMRADPGTVNAAIPRQGGNPSLPEHKCVYFMGQDFHMQCTTSKLRKAPGKPLFANLCSVDRSSSCVLGR